MKQAKKGDTVKVHYVGKLEDDTLFDSSEGKEPLQFTLGTNEIIPGFENAILGMQIGEKKLISIKPEEAYGEHRADLVRDVDRKHVPPNIDPQVGMQLQIGEATEQTLVTITKVAEDSITLDANHPLAGKNLQFDLELVEIV